MLIGYGSAVRNLEPADEGMVQTLNGLGFTLKWNEAIVGRMAGQVAFRTQGSGSSGLALRVRSRITLQNWCPDLRQIRLRPIKQDRRNSRTISRICD